MNIRMQPHEKKNENKAEKKHRLIFNTRDIARRKIASVEVAATAVVELHRKRSISHQCHKNIAMRQRAALIVNSESK